MLRVLLHKAILCGTDAAQLMDGFYFFHRSILKKPKNNKGDAVT
jgi:hypothetical protein